MYQAATQVNVLSSVITNVAEVDAIHKCGRQQYWRHNGQGVSISAGVLVSGMIQDGIEVNLGDPLNSSSRISKKYIETSHKRQGLVDDSVGVGLTGSTLSVGKLRTRGSGQRWRTGFSSCLSNTRRLE